MLTMIGTGMCKTTLKETV